MRILVIGCGSIGLKHLASLKALGQHELQVVEPDDLRRVKAYQYTGKKQAHRSLEDADAYDAAIVCTPTHRHVDDALAVLKAKAHCIIEKPVAHEMERGPELIAARDAAGKVVNVACPMRFHPGLQQIKETVTERKLGDIFVARSWYRQELESWRPGTNYAESYSAKRQTGGGLFLDRIHELDAMRWLFGEPEQVRGSLGHYRDLYPGWEVEHLAFGAFTHGETFATVDLNCISPGYQCGMELIGVKGRLNWDYAPTVNGEVQWHGHELGVQAQAKHWLACLHGDETPAQPLEHAYAVLQTALALYASVDMGQWLRLREPAKAVEQAAA